MQREPELPPDLVEDAGAVLAHQQHEHLGITTRSARQPVPLAQLLVVQDLAVEADREPSVGRAHGLRRAGEVDDRQPPMSERDRPEVGESLVVRPAVDELIGHRRELKRVGCAAVESDLSCDAAHVLALLVRGRAY
ncbi:MAG: hypothetical protein V9E99_06675 [Microthrixaceae bacterium]